MEAFDVRPLTVGIAKGIDRFVHYYTQHGLLAIARKQDGKEAERKKSLWN
jgi:hypothetical protein